MMQCTAKGQTTRDVETKTTVAPTHTIDLVTTYFKGSEQIRQTRENLGKLYGTKTETTVTERTPVIAIPSARIRPAAFEKIADRTIEANRANLDAGFEAAMITRGRGRVVGTVIPAAQPIKGAKEAARQEATPFLDIATINTAQPKDIAQPRMAARLPAATLEAALKGVTALFIETPQERQEREANEKREQQKREAARAQAMQEKTALEARSTTLTVPSKEKISLTTEAAALSTAMAGDVQTIRAAIDRAQSTASATPQPYAELNALYKTEGAAGTFKNLILEYVSVPRPSAEAEATVVALQSSVPGRALIAQVEADLGNVFTSEQEEKRPLKATPAPFENYFAADDFAEASFSLSLGKLRRDHSQEHALAA